MAGLFISNSLIYNGKTNNAHDKSASLPFKLNILLKWEV